MGQTAALLRRDIQVKETGNIMVSIPQRGSSLPVIQEQISGQELNSDHLQPIKYFKHNTKS